jgi:anion-transporting  ArsA/GET3 family ATPase
VSLFDKRFILVGGKGGVGRSTVAAAIADHCARAGKRTLLYETSANDRFGNYFDKPPVGGEIAQLGPNLFAVNATPATALAEYGLMILRWKSVYEMVFENRVTRAFLRAIPGLDDYALLGKAWFHVTEEKRGRPVWDTIIFDMPASGHAWSMLRIPWVIVDTVPEGPLTRDAREVKALLTDTVRTAVVLVTLAEEMPVNEVLELEAKLGTLGITAQHLVANQVFPEHFPPDAPIAKVLDALVAEPAPVAALAALAEHAGLSRDRRRLNARYMSELVRRAQAPVVQLPMVFAQRLEHAHIAALGDRLSELLAGGPHRE